MTHESDRVTPAPKFEYILNYISLMLDVGEERKALEEWLSAMDSTLEKAIFSQALQLLQMIKKFRLSPLGLAQIELARASWYESRDENEDAIKSFQKAIRVFRRLGDRSSEALTSNSLGLLYQKISQNDKAIIHFRVAARLYKRVEDHKALGEVLSNIGSIADSQNDWAKSIPYYERAIREFNLVRAKRELAGAYNNLGVASEMLGSLKIAESAYLHCLNLLDEINQTHSEARWRLISNLAKLNARLENKEKAFTLHNTAFTIATELKSSFLCAITLNNLGMLQEELGNNEQAVNYYREALNYQSELGDRNTQAMLLNNLGSVLTNLKEFGQAQLCLSDSIELSRDVEDLAGEARTLNNLAILHEKQGQFDLAIRSYQKAVEIFSLIGDTRREITSLTNLASVSWKVGFDDIGQDAFHKASQLARDSTYNNELAILFQLKGDWAASNQHSIDLAKNWYKKAITKCSDNLLRKKLIERLASITQNTNRFKK